MSECHPVLSHDRAELGCCTLKDLQRLGLSLRRGSLGPGPQQQQRVDRCKEP